MRWRRATFRWHPGRGAVRRPRFPGRAAAHRRAVGWRETARVVLPTSSDSVGWSSCGRRLRVGMAGRSVSLFANRPVVRPRRRGWPERGAPVFSVSRELGSRKRESRSIHWLASAASRSTELARAVLRSSALACAGGHGSGGSVHRCVAGGGHALGFASFRVSLFHEGIGLERVATTGGPVRFGAVCVRRRAVVGVAGALRHPTSGCS